MIQAEIAPQEIVVEAPLDLVMDVIVSAEYRALPGGGVTAHLLEGAPSRKLIEFITSDLSDPDPVIKEILIDPPDHVVYLHVAGPYPGTVEEIQLRPTVGATVITLTARYRRHDGTARMVRHFLEEGAREQLAQLKQLAESRARIAGLFSAMVPVPRMTSKEVVQGAAIEQEEAEWGYAGHGSGVARIAVALAHEMRLPPRHIEDLHQAAVLHDLGKIALDSNLWASRRTLSREQRRRLESHARLGAQLAARAHFNDTVLTTILHHHEHWNGSGYPSHLVGPEIPLKARILGLAEHVDTMLRAGLRRDALPVWRIIAVLRQSAGREWEPLLAHRMVRMLQGRGTATDPTIGVTM